MRYVRPARDFQASIREHDLVAGESARAVAAEAFGANETSENCAVLAMDQARPQPASGHAAHSNHGNRIAEAPARSCLGWSARSRCACHPVRLSTLRRDSKSNPNAPRVTYTSARLKTGQCVT